MIKKLFMVAILIGSIECVAQFGPQRIIDPNVQNPRMVRTGDIDGDGDLDVAAAGSDLVVWYENLDGQGGFGPRNVVLEDEMLGQIFSIAMEDLNGDGHLDLLGTSFDMGIAYWLENLDGEGNFGSIRIISSDVFGADDIIAADINGDGAFDVVVNADGDNTLSWFENIDGNGIFGQEQIVTSTASNGRSVQAGDLDGDGYIDLMTSSSGSITIAWFKNMDGNGTFGNANIIAGTASAVEEIFVVDINGDNHLDVVSATNANDKVAWHENLNGSGTFGPQVVITTEAGNPRSVYAIDLDNDGDPDVLSIGSDSMDAKIAWYENLDGLGEFGPLQVIEGIAAESSRSVYAADLDGDGDNDVIGALLREDKIAWYENLTILGIAENESLDILLYPNPSNSKIFVQTNHEVISKIEIYGVLGKQLLTKTGAIKEFDISTFPKGVYFVKIDTDSGSAVKKILKN